MNKNDDAADEGKADKRRKKKTKSLWESPADLALLHGLQGLCGTALTGNTCNAIFSVVAAKRFAVSGSVLH